MASFNFHLAVLSCLAIFIPFLHGVPMRVCPIGLKTCYNIEDNVPQGCCQGENAMCCKDMLHCCPENFVCNDTYKKCMPVKQHLLSNVGKNIMVHSPKDVVCEDGVTRCPDLTTCCLLPPGGYGCCQYPEAKCCSDKKHCCPKGFDCIEGTDKCKKDSTIKLAHIISSTRSNMCSDNKTICLNNFNCCKQQNNSYGCCPPDSPNCCGAYCCSSDMPVCCGGMYCCKEQPGCDTVAKKCKLEREIPYSIMKHVHIIEGIKLGKAQEKKTFFNLSGSTERRCDLLQRSCDQGCCPDGKGTCCSNRNYCCPQNYSCTSDRMCALLKD